MDVVPPLQLPKKCFDILMEDVVQNVEQEFLVDMFANDGVIQMMRIMRWLKPNVAKIVYKYSLFAVILVPKNVVPLVVNVLP